MKILYGYEKKKTGEIIIKQEQAETVKLIYDLYLHGKSLGGIANALKNFRIPSPTGKPAWTRAAIDNILSNGRYIPWIIAEDQFWKVQIEKERRTNLDENSRKATRYNSQNVLSGLLVCTECGSHFRRLTRSSGEVVWRCADKVENGKQAVCSNARTVLDAEIKSLICEQLNIEFFDEVVVRDMIDAIALGTEGIEIQMKSSQSLDRVIL